jgi:hypothetical protein
MSLLLRIYLGSVDTMTAATVIVSHLAVIDTGGTDLFGVSPTQLVRFRALTIERGYDVLGWIVWRLSILSHVPDLRYMPVMK